MEKLDESKAGLNRRDALKGMTAVAWRLLRGHTVCRSPLPHPVRVYPREIGSDAKTRTPARATGFSRTSTSL